MGYIKNSIVMLTTKDLYNMSNEESNLWYRWNVDYTLNSVKGPQIRQLYYDITTTFTSASSLHKCMNKWLVGMF